MIHYKVSCS